MWIERDLLEEALIAEREGRWTDAAGLYASHLAREPYDALALKHAGFVYLNNQMWREAADLFMRLVDMGQGDEWAYTGLGRAYDGLGYLEKAIDALRKAIDLQQSPSRWIYLGSVLAQLSRTGEAEDAFRSAIALDDKCEEAYFALGLELRRRDRHAAQMCFSRALAIDPAYAEAMREIGFIRFADGLWQDSIDLLNRAISLEPADGWSHFYLALALSRQGLALDASREFDRALECLPDAEVLVAYAAEHFESVADREKAVTLYERLASMVKPPSRGDGKRGA